MTISTSLCNKVTDFVINDADGRMKRLTVKCNIRHTDNDRRQKHKGTINWQGSFNPLQTGNYPTHHLTLEWIE